MFGGGLGLLDAVFAIVSVFLALFRVLIGIALPTDPDG